ncbi:hypothetical protein PoB_005914200 [Plakobranchus ocellatus]|uniref:Uncharacterized protein n=1 Tax=Plakobranchus ocellatus TaxID=259542 RepID=A0AAV4CLC5_9GAST|nr:hypothetical protein PoB_005914200 [Plakobranchus ocellatus]
MSTNKSSREPKTLPQNSNMTSSVVPPEAVKPLPKHSRLEEHPARPPPHRLFAAPVSKTVAQITVLPATTAGRESGDGSD